MADLKDNIIKLEKTSHEFKIGFYFAIRQIRSITNDYTSTKDIHDFLDHSIEMGHHEYLQKLKDAEDET